MSAETRRKKLQTLLRILAGKTYEQVRAGHISDYQKYFNRVSLNPALNNIFFSAPPMRGE